MRIMFEHFKRICNSVGDRIAYVGSNGEITYYELYNKVCIYSELLKKQGTSPVVIYGHKETDYVIAILSCLIAKRTYVPVDWFMPEGRLQHIIELTGAELIINCSDDSSINTDVETVSLSELELFSSENIKASDNENAYIIFTSGSTGKPKGVPITYSNLSNFISWISSKKMLGSYADAIVLNQASFSFDLSVADLFYSIFNGHTLVALSKNELNDHTDILNKLKEHKVKICVVTPTFIRFCLLTPDFNSGFLPELSCIYFCGEKLEISLVRKLIGRFPELEIINAYGPTEATSAVSGIFITEDMLSGDILPVGETDNFSTDISINNEEIILKGKSVFNGYLGESEGGYYCTEGISCFKTGDIGYIKDNKLYCIGRRDNQIKYKGYRIELNDIESNILMCDGVTECAVIAAKGSGGEVRYIRAFVVLEQATGLDSIKKQIAEKLPFYMIPKVFTVIDQLPTNDNKKTDRARLSLYD